MNIRLEVIVPESTTIEEIGQLKQYLAEHGWTLDIRLKEEE